MKRDLVLEELVIEEATNLKKYATKEELSRLDYDNLDGDSKSRCIYGQMTGDCSSYRANELIIKCAQKVYNTTDTDDRIVKSVLNGKPYKIDKVNERLDFYISPIEKFLYKYKRGYKESTKIKKLVNFLQDKTQELKF